jgi:uncharacterized protein
VIVVADTSPPNYLIQIDCAELLNQLYHEIYVPIAVWEELCHPGAPAAVRQWVVQQPPWIALRATHSSSDLELSILDRGESEAIQVALELNAGTLLMDERRGWLEANRRGLTVTGTLGVLLLAGRLGLTNPEVAFCRLISETNFRVSADLETSFIAQVRSIR